MLRLGDSARAAASCKMEKRGSGVGCYLGPSLGWHDKARRCAGGVGVGGGGESGSVTREEEE